LIYLVPFFKKMIRIKRKMEIEINPSSLIGINPLTLFKKATKHPTLSLIE